MIPAKQLAKAGASFPVVESTLQREQEPVHLIYIFIIYYMSIQFLFLISSCYSIVVLSYSYYCYYYYLVIGVYDNFMWFHVDGDRGASYWDNCKSYEDLLQLGFCLVDMPDPEPEFKQG